MTSSYQNSLFNVGLKRSARPILYTFENEQVDTRVEQRDKYWRKVIAIYI